MHGTEDSEEPKGENPPQRNLYVETQEDTEAAKLFEHTAKELVAEAEEVGRRIFAENWELGNPLYKQEKWAESEGYTYESLKKIVEDYTPGSEFYEQHLQEAKEKRMTRDGERSVEMQQREIDARLDGPNFSRFKRDEPKTFKEKEDVWKKKFAYLQEDLRWDVDEGNTNEGYISSIGAYLDRMKVSARKGDVEGIKETGSALENEIILEMGRLEERKKLVRKKYRGNRSGRKKEIQTIREFDEMLEELYNLFNKEGEGYNDFMNTAKIKKAIERTDYGNYFYNLEKMVHEAAKRGYTDQTRDFRRQIVEAAKAKRKIILEAIDEIADTPYTMETADDCEEVYERENHLRSLILKWTLEPEEDLPIPEEDQQGQLYLPLRFEEEEREEQEQEQLTIKAEIAELNRRINNQLQKNFRQEKATDSLTIMQEAAYRAAIRGDERRAKQMALAIEGEAEATIEALTEMFDKEKDEQVLEYLMEEIERVQPLLEYGANGKKFKNIERVLMESKRKN